MEPFRSVPERLRDAIATLIDAPREEVVLANSASYGLHLLANGIPWEAGDEILVVDGDFPANILPWLGVEQQSTNVQVRQLSPQSHLPTPEELAASITPDTRLFCTTWVHSFSGQTAHLQALGEVCRENDVLFVVNAAQGIGARPLSVTDLPVDAVTSVGYKWLCGPYGTGFCWLHTSLLRSLKYNQAYWFDLAAELGDQAEIEIPERAPTARRYDIFGTANFFNFKPWAAAIEYLLDIGVETIASHDQQLVEKLLTGIDETKYDVLSPRDGDFRSTLVFLSHRDRKRNQEIHERMVTKGIDIAYRRGSLRLSPHLYNTQADIESAISVLNSV
jgi:selenocysteine lyase/cysteine desulfurase